MKLLATFLAHSGRLGDNLSNERDLRGDRRSPAYMMSLYLGSKWSVDAWMIRALRSSSDLTHRLDGDSDRDEDAEQASG